MTINLELAESQKSKKPFKVRRNQKTLKALMSREVSILFLTSQKNNYKNLTYIQNRNDSILPR